MSKATITVEGFVTKDPEMRQAAGKNVVAVDIAHTPRKKEGNDWVDAGDTIWFQASFWDRDAQPIMDAVRKGTLVTVTGQPELNVYQKQDGSPAVSVRIKFGTLGVVPRADNGAGQNANQGQRDWAQPAGGSAGPVSQPQPTSYTQPGGADPWAATPNDTEIPF
jgi:single-strand DNA-binding protein